MKYAKELLYLFVRYPEPGRTLTNLEPHLDGMRAAQLSQRIAEHVVQDTDSLVHPGLERIVVVDPPDRLESAEDWLGDSFTYRGLPGRTQATSLETAFAIAFNAGVKRVVAMQTNCLDLEADFVRRAFGALHRADAALGPAQSGACALIGLRALKPGFLTGIDWSSKHAFLQIKSKLIQSRLRCEYAPRVHDLNSVEDLNALATSWPDILDDFAIKTS